LPRKHKEYWEAVTGLTQAKGFILGSSARRTQDLLKLNIDQVGGRITYRTLSPKRATFKIGTDL
jgi:hypothetical protein